MERTAWTDERLDDSFALLRAEAVELRREMHHLRTEMHARFAQMKLFMLGGLVTILAAVIALHG
jgi:hypothetical protein